MLMIEVLGAARWVSAISCLVAYIEKGLPQVYVMLK